MMGQLPGGQQCLFYSFNLEDHVPAQHLLRSIYQYLDLRDLEQRGLIYFSAITASDLTQPFVAWLTDTTD